MARRNQRYPNLYNPAHISYISVSIAFSFYLLTFIMIFGHLLTGTEALLATEDHYAAPYYSLTEPKVP